MFQGLQARVSTSTIKFLVRAVNDFFKWEEDKFSFTNEMHYVEICQF